MRGDKAENHRCSGRRIYIYIYFFFFFLLFWECVQLQIFSQVNELCNYARISQGKKKFIHV